MSDATTLAGQATEGAPQAASPAPTHADETKELKTYEDALAYINAAIQGGSDPKLLAPLQVFFKDRIQRAPKADTPPDEQAVKMAQLGKRTWKPYTAKPSSTAAPPELKI